MRRTDESGGGNGSFRAAMAKRRERMVAGQLVPRGIRDERVLEAMRRIERHRFVSDPYVESAYGDFPIPIAAGQTMSQPYIVGLMTEALGLSGDEKVLEIGTGSGYQTAVLAELAREIYTIEIVAELADRARQRLCELGYENIHYRVGDGRDGWPEAAPFDAILAAAAPDRVPTKLEEQLAEGGRLVIPIGPPDLQELELYERRPGAGNGFAVRRLGAVRFVPFV